MNLDEISRVKQAILSKYKYRTELHAHTSPGSMCADFAPEDVLKYYAGYDSIAITNHFIYQERFLRFDKEPTAEEYVRWFLADYNKAKDVSPKYNLNVILGAEIRFSENNNDYLVYGIDEKILIEIYKSLEYGIEGFKKNDALNQVLIIQAHPFRNGMEEINPDWIDGIEGFNMHSGHNSRIAKTVKFAKDNNKTILTAGSDFHHINGEKMAALLTDRLVHNSFELADILREQNYALEISENSIILP